MATTYLQLVNRVLNRLNEVNLTSSNFASITGVHATVKDAVNDSIKAIHAAAQEWPFLYSAISQTLTSGTNEYAHSRDLVDWDSFKILMPELLTNGEFTSDITTGWTDIDSGTGTSSYSSGRARLNAGASGVAALTQAITTVTGQRYRVRTKVYGGTVVLKIGTTSGGTEISTTSLTVTNDNRGDWADTFFTATASSTYITISNTANANYEVDSISVKEATSFNKLKYLSYDEFLRLFSEIQLQQSAESFTLPVYVYPLPNLKFGLHPIPDKEYVVTADAWAFTADLSLYSDNTTIPDKFTNVVVEGAMEIMYMFREDFEQSAMQRDKFRKLIESMRAQLIVKADTMAGSSHFNSMPFHNRNIF